MERMKTFSLYVISIILIIVVGNWVINGLLRTSYTKIKDYEIDVSDVYVDITETKVSRWNGNIKGIVKNNTEKTVENKFLRVSFMSKNKRILGEKYIRLEKLEPEDLRRFEVDFDYDNVKTFKIELVDTMPEGVSFIELIKENLKDIKNDLSDKKIDL